MNRIPCLGAEWSSTGFLYTDNNPAALGEDMFEASLSNGITIEAGWSREADPDGFYLVRVTRGFDDILPPFRANNIDEAVIAIEQRAAELTKPLLPKAVTSEISVRTNGPLQ